MKLCLLEDRQDAAAVGPVGHELDQAQIGVRGVGGLVGRLAQEGVDLGHLGDRVVDAGVRARAVGADRDQVLLGPIGRERLAQRGGGVAHRGRRHLVGQPRHRLEDVDRGVVALVGERAREHAVAVEDRAHRVGDRLVHVVALDEHRVEAGDRSAPGRARALEQLRQHREHARRVAARRRRLADGEADLALGDRKPRDRVHHQQHVVAGVAEVLGDRRRDEGRLDPHERRLVGRRDDDDRARQGVAEVALDELEQLAAALADQADHVHRRRGRARDRAQERRLADARAGEDAQALAAPAGDERVEGAHAELEPLADPRPVHRRRRHAGDRARLPAADLRPAVDRAAEAVQHASEQGVADRHAERPARRLDDRAGGDPAHVAERHQQRAPVAEADDLGGHRGAVAAAGDRDQLADLGPQAGGLDHEADQVDDAAAVALQVGLGDRP